LLKLNRIISVRLVLHDSVPSPLRNYRVHDGRVTFTIPGEFELDLSVAEESSASQFFFVDIRFLFTPSSPIPKGRIFNELDGKINEVLRADGLMGCFHFLHGLVLTNKINILFKQATELARGLWANALHIELLHRTLVVQYWPQRSGPKSWLEIGIKSGHRTSGSNDSKSGISHLGFRWVRDGQQVSSDSIKFNSNDLSMERILRSAIALHTSHLISTAFATLKKHLLFSTHTLSLQAQLSSTEPGDCRLDVQLTASRSLRVSIEPMSGSITLCGVPNMLERLDGDRTVFKSTIEEILSRVSRLRCLTAVDEIESATRALGLEPVSQRVLGTDPRRLFPPGVVRTALFTHRLWNKHWVAAATSSMDGDHWWLVQLRPLQSAKEAKAAPLHHIGNDNPNLPRAHIVSESLVPPKTRLDFTTCATLVDGLTGILAMHANARYLADLSNIHFWPSLKELHLEPNMTVPELLFNYNSSILPSAFRVAQPSGVNTKPRFKEMVRLVFHGIDRQSHSAIIVARGTFKVRMKCLASLVSKTDPSLIIEDSGTGFALRLLVPAGHSVIVSVFERLQRLECVLSIFEPLIRKGMEARSLSLSQVAFLYGPDKQYSASFDIGVRGPSLSDYVDVTGAVSKTKPIFQLDLGIKFDSSSPHRRIQEALSVNLNNPSSGTGVDKTLGLLNITLPLLRSLDQITDPSSSMHRSIVHITVRKPTEYQLHYPRLKSRFQLNLTLHQDMWIWVLKDSNSMDQPGRNQVITATREKIYQSRGEGWQGLADGAKASSTKIGNLILVLHECMNAPNLELEKVEAKPEQFSEQTRIKGATSAPSRQPIGLGNTDVITID
jgi:mediator of RNA polymerase II transcription subunit 14